MAQTIKIKRSSTTTAPSSLASGELAYSTKTGVQKLYYGDGNDVLAIGGKSYTDKLDGIEAGANVTDTANVTAAGALMDSEVTNLAQVKAFDSSDYVLIAGSTLTGNLNFNDNVKAKFGTGGDMELFHDGNNSIIKDSGDGILRYTSSNSTNQGVVLEVENTDSTNLSGSFIHFKDSLGITPAKIGALSNEMYLMRGSNNDRILVTNASAVELYHSDVKKFETTTDGIAVDGDADISGDLTAGNFTFTGDEISSSGSTMTLDPHADGITGKVVVNGDLEVKGTTTTIDSTQVTINDAYLQLNSGLGASATPVSSMICGFEVNRGAGETGSTHDAGLYWYEGSNEWKVSEGQTASHVLIHANNFESVFTSLDGGTF